MIQMIVLEGILFAGLCGVATVLAPDAFSMVITVVMTAATMAGYFFGMVPAAMYAVGFRKGIKTVNDISEVQSESHWQVAKNTDEMFRQKTLDTLYAGYIAQAERQERDGLVPGDLEDVLNEESLALRSWQRVIHQLPGTLTALGLLGTFIGLIVGISRIGFSSLEAALSSIEVLLTGTRTAFFTSIAGVILSVVFNILHKLQWNVMLREMGLFYERFHLNILPDSRELNDMKRRKDLSVILERLDRLPGITAFSNSKKDSEDETEQQIMPEIREGLRRGEFIFYVQPRYDLNTKKINGGEALVRWRHADLGIVSPAAFLSVVEKNGFIVRIDRFLWESVCRQMADRIRQKKPLVPISVNVSKTDILVMDVAAFFINLVSSYRIPPRYLEVEIAESAYVQCEQEARELEGKLRQAGFRVLADGFSGDFVAVNILRRCEVDAVKLDMRFFSAREPDVLRNGFDQAKAIGRPVIAVGIETAEELTVLRSCACEAGQGYLLHKPMSVSDFENEIDRDMFPRI